MIINKRCIAAFAPQRPLLALATKSKLFDPTFSLTSELLLIDFLSGRSFPSVTTDMKFCSLRWCETPDALLLAAGHENGAISLYKATDSGLEHLTTRSVLEDDVTALEYLRSKSVLAAGSPSGHIIFWTLTDLEKEYSLDIPLSVDVVSLAWNRKATKILAAGTRDNQIKLLDIKKNKVVTTLTHPEMKGVSKIFWDDENSMQLLVLSEKGPLLAFDLSNDTVSVRGVASDPVIGFHRTLLVTRHSIEDGSMVIRIKDSVDCAISENGSIVALSHSDGSTELISVPSLRAKNVLVRQANVVCGLVRGNKLKRAVIILLSEQNAHKDARHSFYSGLINMLTSKAPHAEIAEYILNNSSSSELIDLNEQTVALIRGDLSAFRADDRTVPFGYLIDVIRKDSSSLQEIRDFQLLFVLCKILGEYSPLLRMGNPRVIAASLLFHGIEDYSALSGASGEAMALHGLLTGNTNQYVSNAIETDGTYIDFMARVGAVLEDARKLSASPIESSVATEYFWYRVFRGESEQLKDLNIRSDEIEAYRNPLLATGLAKQQSAAVLPRTGLSDLNRSFAEMRMTPGAQWLYKPEAVPVSPSSVVVPTTHTPVSGAVVEPQQPAKMQGAFYRQPPMMASTTTAIPSRPLSTPVQYPVSPGLSARIPTPPERVIPSPRAIPVASQAPIGRPIPMASSVAFSRPPIPASGPRMAVPEPSARPAAVAAPVSGSGAVPVADRVQIFARFDALLHSLRERAATKNSLLIRPRKIQCLNALDTYSTVNKDAVPLQILNAMELLVKRMDAPGDGRLKLDVDLIVQDQQDCMWLRAAAELIKLLY